MFEKRPQNGLKVYLGIVFLLGGGCCILIPAITLPRSDITMILMGISFIMLGDSYIWSAIEGLRKEKLRKKDETKNIKSQ
jgi:uncharacterized membrane protein HdeD (DUF308 family)